METISLILSIILVVFAVALVVVVLLQKTKSSGLGAAYGGDTQTFGSRGKAASREVKLQKLTVVCAIVVGVLAIALLIVDQFVDTPAVSESMARALIK